MIKDVPSPQDFFDAGIELFDFAWDTVAVLLTNIDIAEKDFGEDVSDLSEEYWASSKRRLTTALAMTQQGVEFILKGKIAEVSPYVLLAESTRWPSPYDGHELTFSEFKTIDAQELVRVHDTVQATPLSDAFSAKFDVLRKKRNTISHSIDKKLQVHTMEVIETILFLHKALFPNENWAKVRANFIKKYPDASLSGGEYSINNACHEMEIVIRLLPPASVEAFFGINRKDRLYLCPTCLYESSHHVDFDYKLAALRPKSATASILYCPICDIEYKVSREDCNASDCKGNVISDDEERRCLTCGEYQEAAS